MRINAKKLGLAFGILWAAAALFLCFYPWLAERLFDAPEKGTALLALLENTYPWVDHTTFIGVVAAVVMAFIDAFICGFLLGWLYNVLPGKK